jgi:ferric-dicitrate binding protein FerR (iron transport regulator)
VAAAAAILFALFSTAWFATRHSEKPIGRTAGIQHQFSAKRGMRSRMILPDGSTVLLNSDSKLSYPQAFSDTLREVFLDGEAFFDVTKQPKRPFIVHTSGMRIKVLGTAFNVKAYADEKTIETSLIRGSIEVSVSYRPNEKIILSPNEKLVIRSHELPEVISSQNTILVKPEIAINQLKPDPLDSTIAETQWTENRLVFRNESLADIARRMERWYNVTIQIKNEELKDALFSGTFTSETIDEALHALTYSKGLHYEIKEEKIVIHQ